MASAEAQQAVIDARTAIAEEPEESTLRSWAEILAVFVVAGELTQNDVLGALVSAWVAATGDKGTAVREITRGLADGGAEVAPPKEDIAKADLAEAVSMVSGASQGRRHDTLFERAAFMGKHIRAGTITRGEVQAALMRAWETATSGRSKEGQRTIADGIAGARGAFQYAQRPEQGTAWVDIFKVGAEVHRDGYVVVLDRDTIVTMMRNFERMQSEGHEVVVLREHEREGHVFGFVHGLRLFEGFLQANLEFLRPDDRDAYNNGQLRRFSPGFTLNFVHPHSGEEWGPTLFEVSFVAMPFQTNLRPPQEANPETRLAFNYSGDILQGEDMAIEAKTEAPVEEPVEASDVALAADEEEESEEPTLGQMYALMKEMYAFMKPDDEEMAEDEEEGGEEMSDSERQIRELSAKVDRLTDEKCRVELKAAGVPVEHHDHLVKLSRTDRSLYEFTADKLAEVKELRQAPIGVTGDAETSGSSDVAFILSQAEEAGVKYGKGLTTWLAKNYREEMADVLAAVRD